METERLLTPDEVAAWLGRKRDWVLDQGQQGKLPVHKIGRQCRYRPAEIQAYIDGAWKPESEAAQPLKPRRGRPRKYQ